MDHKAGDPSGEDIWNQKFKCELDLPQEKLLSMYTDNLKYVISHIEELLINNFGKIVVTGDHGNYIGEHASPIPTKECGHPHGMYDEPVIRIPWLEINTGNRRQITSELTNKSSKEIQDDVVTE